MASIIKIKRSATPSSVPGSLAAGELAINTADKKLFSSDGSTVFQIGDNALANTNLAIADRLQVANAAATYETKATADSRLANTNAYIATKVSTSTFNSALANTNAYIATKLNSSSYTASDVLSKLTTVDGASSGLDADLLDGQQGSYYAVEATEKSRLANTNAYIASVQSDVNANEATERAALANTNAYIATKANASGPSTSGFFNHTGRLTVGTNLTVSGNTVIDGNLTVEGGVTYISSSTLNVDDSMIKLAANNAADTVDTGAYAKYIESATTKYTGYFRDASDGVFKFYAGLQSEPTTTVNTGGTGYTIAQVDAIIDGGTY